MKHVSYFKKVNEDGEITDFARFPVFKFFKLRAEGWQHATPEDEAEAEALGLHPDRMPPEDVAELSEDEAEAQRKEFEKQTGTATKKKSKKKASKK